MKKNLGITMISLIVISVLLVMTLSMDIKAITNEIKVTAQVKGTPEFLGQTWGLTLTLIDKETGQIVDRVAEEFVVKNVNNLQVSMPISENIDLTKHFLNVNAGSHLHDIGVDVKIQDIIKNNNVKIDLADAI